MELTGAITQMRAAVLQWTTVPMKNIMNIPMDVNICVTVHNAPRMLGSLKKN